MLLVAVVVVLLATCAAASDFASCENNSTSPVEVQVPGCSVGRCNFTSGSQVSVKVIFKVDHLIKTLTPRLTQNMLGNVNDVALLETDGCKSLVEADCPIEDGETVTYLLRFIISDYGIVTPVVLTFWLADQTSVNVTCFVIPGNIVL